MDSSPPFIRSALRYWLLALIVLIPFSTNYIVNKTVAVSYLNVWSIIFIILGVFGLMTREIKAHPVRDRGTLAVIGMLLLAMAYALLFTHPLRNGIGLWGSRLVQPLLVGWFAYEVIVVEIVSFDELVQAFFYSLIPLILGAGLQAAHLLPYFEPHRITVLYHFANTFARYLVIILLLSLPWLLTQSWSLGRALLWAAGVVLLLTTLSYNGFLSLLVGVIAILFYLPANQRRLKQVGFAVIGATGVLITLFATHLPKWQTSITGSRLTRLEFWHVALGVIRDHFWTGIGLKGWESQYGQLVLKYGHFPPLNYSSAQPHDVFLDSFVKAGLPGFIAITILLLWPIWRGYQVYRGQPFKQGGWFGLSLLSYGLAMLSFGLIDDPLWSDDTMPVLFILLLALALSFSTMHQKRSRSS